MDDVSGSGLGDSPFISACVASPLLCIVLSASRVLSSVEEGGADTVVETGIADRIVVDTGVVHSEAVGMVAKEEVGTDVISEDVVVLSILLI